MAAYFGDFLGWLFTTALIQSSINQAWAITMISDASMEQLIDQTPCAGSSLELPWVYTLSNGEVLQEVRWSHSGKSQELMAVYSQNRFDPLPAYASRVHWLQGKNAGIELRKLTPTDSGQYTVMVTGQSSSGSGFAIERSVNITVIDRLQSSDGELHMSQGPELLAVRDPRADQWSVELRCGHFSFPQQPPFDLEWITPTGAVESSSGYKDGYFTFLVPHPVPGGIYRCRALAQLNSVCAPTDKEDSLALDASDIRFAILQARLNASYNAQVQMEKEYQQLQTELRSVTSRVSSRERCHCYHF